MFAVPISKFLHKNCYFYGPSAQLVMQMLSLIHSNRVYLSVLLFARLHVALY